MMHASKGRDTKTPTKGASCSSRVVEPVVSRETSAPVRMTRSAGREPPTQVLYVDEQLVIDDSALLPYAGSLLKYHRHKTDNWYHAKVLTLAGVSIDVRVAATAAVAHFARAPSPPPGSMAAGEET